MPRRAASSLGPRNAVADLSYERAVAYEESGNTRRARTEFEQLYAEDSTFADVAARLGVAAARSG